MDKKELLLIKEDIRNQFNKQNELSFSQFININSYNIIKRSNLFDESFYLSNYPDVKLNNLDPIYHYLKLGTYENCNPNADFNTKEYLNKYEDVKNSSLNPFVHYILYGVHENRTALNPLLELEEKYFVSIIMPTFNRRSIIYKSIDSVLNQTFKNLELIIIDDGSTDGTDTFIKNKYSQLINSNKIKYFKLNHVGVCAARNYGLKEAKGNMIAYLDSDNQWINTFLETIIKELDLRDEYNCAYCGVNVNNRTTNHQYVLSREFNRKKLLKGNFIDLNSFVHDRSLYDAKGGFDENLTRLVDWDLIIKYTEKNDPLYIEENLVNYFIDKKYNNISLVESESSNADRIHQKYWHEAYLDEYETIVDVFDYGYYLDNYDDVLKSGINPLYHFLSVGHEEGKNPNSEFITEFYKNKYPDVVQNKLNPLVHYIKWGEKEGREINYFDQYEKLLKNNFIHLSNYVFDEEPLVSIIILNKDGLPHLKKLFKDFNAKTNYSNFEIIIVDNNSSDGSIDFLNSLNLPITIITNEKNLSFSKCNNEAVEIANGDYILLLNNDVEPTFGWLNEIMGTMLYNENIGAVGAKLVFPYILEKDKNKYSFTVQHFGEIFEETTENYVYDFYNQKRYQQNIFDCELSTNKKCVSVTGAALLTKKSIYLELDGLDESYWYGCETVDFNLKLQKNGYNILLAASALLFHEESSTLKNQVQATNYEILYEKWNTFLFTNILRDKINNSNFFTEKALNFLIVLNHNYYENQELINCISNLLDYLNEKGYNSQLEFDVSNFNVSEDVDIIISFTNDYNIKNINARRNIIKILFLDETSYNLDNITNWDIILSNGVNVTNFNSIYHVDELSNIGENIISSLEDCYLNN